MLAGSSLGLLEKSSFLGMTPLCERGAKCVDGCFPMPILDGLARKKQKALVSKRIKKMTCSIYLFVLDLLEG